MLNTPVPPSQEAPAADDVEVEVTPPEIPRQRALTTHEAAQRIGMSIAWMKQHAHEIGGRLTSRGYRFPAELSVETVRTRITLKRSQKFRAITEHEDREGELAKKVFTALDNGVPTRLIVRELGIAPETVQRLTRAWIECGRFDETEFAVIHGRRKANE